MRFIRGFSFHRAEAIRDLARHPPAGVWEEGEGLSKDSRNGLADTAGGRL
jgi:hypothetical protein